MGAIILTGSIATGKSTVASLLKLYGYKIVCADEIAHQELSKHSDVIEQMFGTSDRAKLREIIFSNSQKRKMLEDFLHPKIKQRILQESHKMDLDGVAYFLDIPLYFEKQNYNDFTQVAVVYTPKEQQLARLSKRDNITKEEAQKIIDLQMDIELKKQKATYVIDNSKDLKHLQNEVENFIKQI